MVSGPWQKNRGQSLRGFRNDRIIFSVPQEPPLHPLGGEGFGREQFGLELTAERLSRTVRVRGEQKNGRG